MKTKNKIIKTNILVLNIFLLLNIFCILNANAAYTINQDVRDKFVYKITSLDDDVLDTVEAGGLDMDDYVGKGFEEDAMMCFEIVEIERDSTSWKMKLYIWDWTDDESDFQADPAGYNNLEVFLAPGDAGEDVVYEDISYDYFSLIPSEVDDYIKDIDWEENYSTSGNKIKWEPLPGMKYTFEFDDNGLLLEWEVEFWDETFLKIKNQPIEDAGIDWVFIILLVIVIGAIVGLTALTVILVKRRKASAEERGLKKYMKKSREDVSEETKKIDKKFERSLKKKDKPIEGIDYKYVKGPKWKKIVGILLILIGIPLILLFLLIMTVVSSAMNDPSVLIRWERVMIFIIAGIIGLLMVIMGFVLIITGKKRKVSIEDDEEDDIEDDDDDEFTVSTTKKCTKCGWITSVGSNKCPNCGFEKAVSEKEPKVMETTHPPTIPTEPKTMETAPPPTMSPEPPITPSVAKPEEPITSSFHDKLVQKNKLNQEILEIEDKIREIDNKFFNREIEQDEYLSQKTALFEKKGELEARRELLSEN